MIHRSQILLQLTNVQINLVQLVHVSTFCIAKVYKFVDVVILIINQEKSQIWRKAAIGRHINLMLMILLNYQICTYGEKFATFLTLQLLGIQLMTILLELMCMEILMTIHNHGQFNFIKCHSQGSSLLSVIRQLG